MIAQHLSAEFQILLVLNVHHVQYVKASGWYLAVEWMMTLQNVPRQNDLTVCAQKDRWPVNEGYFIKCPYTYIILSFVEPYHKRYLTSLLVFVFVVVFQGQ